MLEEANTRKAPAAFIPQKSCMIRAPAHFPFLRKQLSNTLDIRLVEFVWLDMACIDQNPGSPDAAAEIGRQAKIFKGASHVYAWLNTLYFDTVTRLLCHGSGLDEWLANMDRNMEESVADLNDVPSADLVQYLISNP